MELTTVKTYPLLTFVLVILSVCLSADGSTTQHLFSGQARAASENELEVDCEVNQELCLIEACFGNKCSNIEKGLGISEIFSGMTLSSSGPMDLGGKGICQKSDEKDVINNFNFRTTPDVPDEIGANNNLGRAAQLASAWWDHSGSDILIGMDLGMIKRICDIDVHFNNKAEVRDGFSVTVSNSSTNFQKDAEQSTGSLLHFWSPGSDSVAARFVYIMIPNVSEFYLDDDDEDDPLVSHIRIKAFSPTNSVENIKLVDNITKQKTQNATTQLKLSPLEFLSTASDLLDTTTFKNEHSTLNRSSLSDMSSILTPNLYTGDIFMP